MATYLEMTPKVKTIRLTDEALWENDRWRHLNGTPAWDCLMRTGQYSYFEKNYYDDCRMVCKIRVAGDGGLYYLPYAERSFCGWKVIEEIGRTKDIRLKGRINSRGEWERTCFWVCKAEILYAKDGERVEIKPFEKYSLELHRYPTIHVSFPDD